MECTKMESLRSQFLILLPDDNCAICITWRQQALIVVEADIQNRSAMSLQFVDALLAILLDVKEIYIHIFASSHYQI